MNRSEKNYNTIILELLGTRPIAFNPLLAKIGKSANAGLFLSQLLYWWNKGYKTGWIYKTIKEAQEETALTRAEQDTAINTWKGLGILTVKKMGLPQKRHFKIHTKKLIGIIKKQQTSVLETVNQFAENSKLNCGFKQNNTENTSRKYLRKHAEKKEKRGEVEINNLS